MFILDPERSSKLSPRYYGPCRIVKQGHGNKFTVRVLESGVERVVHADNLKRVHPEYPLPTEPPESSAPAPPESPSPSLDDVSFYRNKLRSANR